jgi:hypothetical protein
MRQYYYRGRRYTKKQAPSQQVWRTVKHIANRVYEATSGDHPGGAQALVEKLIEQYPEKRPVREPPAVKGNAEKSSEKEEAVDETKEGVE